MEAKIEQLKEEIKLIKKQVKNYKKTIVKKEKGKDDDEKQEWITDWSDAIIMTDDLFNHPEKLNNL